MVHLGRRSDLLLSLVCALALSGCASLPTPPATGFVIAMAKTDANDSATDGKVHTPAWLLLLPVSVPFDIVFMPVYLLSYFFDKS
jgi:uncharacterized protein YceK